jgi:hypothetical protein
MRDLSVTTTPLASTLLAIRDFSPTVYAGYTTLNGLKQLTAGTPLTDAVIAQGTRLTAAETLAAPLTSLTSTLIAVRNLTAGTPLYTTVTGYNTRLTALENLSGSPSSTLYTTLTGHSTTLSDVGTRLSAAENLNGTATTLTSTVKQVRDLTSGTPLFTAVDGLRTLASGTALTDAVIGMRDMSVTGSALVTAVKQSQTDAALLFQQAKLAYANDSALAASTAALQSRLSSASVTLSFALPVLGGYDTGVALADWHSAIRATAFNNGKMPAFTVPAGAGGKYALQAGGRLHGLSSTDYYWIMYARLFRGGAMVDDLCFSISGGASGAQPGIMRGDISTTCSWAGTLLAGDVVKLMYLVSGTTPNSAEFGLGQGNVNGAQWFVRAHSTAAETAAATSTHEQPGKDVSSRMCVSRCSSLFLSPGSGPIRSSLPRRALSHFEHE